MVLVALRAAGIHRAGKPLLLSFGSIATSVPELHATCVPCILQVVVVISAAVTHRIRSPPPHSLTPKKPSCKSTTTPRWKPPLAPSTLTDSSSRECKLLNCTCSSSHPRAVLTSASTPSAASSSASTKEVMLPSDTLWAISVTTRAPTFSSHSLPSIR